MSVQSQNTYDSVQSKDIIDKIEDYDVIDVRKEEKFEKCHINNAKNIKFEKILNKPEEYEHLISEKTVFVCNRGNRSKKVAEKCSKVFGIFVKEISDGMEGWEQNCADCTL